MEVPSFIWNAINKKISGLHRNTNKIYCGVYCRIDPGSHTPVYVKARKNMMLHALNLERYKRTERSSFAKASDQVHCIWLQNKTKNIVVIETIVHSEV